MTCNCNNNSYGCGGACDSDTSNTAIKQAVNDALAGEKETLNGYVTDASTSATEAKESAADAASSASAAAQSQTNAESAAATATIAATSVSNTAGVLEETSKRIEHAQDLIEEQISAIQTKPVYFEITEPTYSLVLSETETVFNVRSIYISSARQAVGYGFTFDKETRTITLAEAITAEQILETSEGYILVEVICDVYSSDDITSLPIQLASKAGSTLVGTSTGVTVETRLTTLDEQVDPTLRVNLGSSDGFSLIGQINSFSKLRTVIPIITGQRVLLSGYYAGSSLGGGEFEAISNAELTDDSGVIAVVNSDWAWRRVLPTEQLTVVDFGAVPDGLADCTPSVKLMHEYAQKNAPHLGIQFPAGNFRMIGGLDISSVYTSRFRISGPSTRFGYLPQTTITVDSATDGVAILVNARFTEVSNIIIEGEIDKVTSKRGFFKNICEAGQYVRGSCIHAKNMGGRAFSLLDTLDTRFDQFYVSACAASFLRTDWSNNASGTWDHVTAIELTNFNIQRCTGEPAIDCVRATQSLMRNGWIERCEYPGNISEGQWIIDALSLEVNTHPFQAQHCRLIKSQINLQGSTIDYESGASSENIPSWVNSVYESGSVDVRNNSLSVIGGSSSTFRYSKNRMANMSGSAKWFKLGRVYNPQTGSTSIIKLLGTRGLESISGNSPEATGFGSGETLINIQNKGDNSKVRVSWYGVGSSPVRAVKYVPASATTTDIYIQLGAYTGEVAVFVESANLSRAEAGTCFYFSPDLNVIDNISTVSGTIDAPSKFSVNNGTYGLGMNFDTGSLMYAGHFENSKVPIIINGVTYYITVSTS